MLWFILTGALLLIVLMIFLLTRTFFLVCCGRQPSGLAGLVIRLGMANAGEPLTEAADGALFWKEASPEAVSITSFDGLTLRGEFLSRPGSQRTVVCVHGYRGTGVSNFALVLPVLAGMGCDILLIDQRACGRSGGSYIAFGMKERHDVAGWCRWLTEERGCRHPIYLDGISLGCSTVLMASDLELPENVCGIIADCGFTSAYEIIASVVRSLLHLPARLVMPLLQLAARRELGMGLDAVSTEDCVRHTRIPILFAHGEKDRFVPPDMGVRNYMACGSEKWLLLSPEAAHGESWLKSREAYMQLIQELFRHTSGGRTQEV